ncbi:MAG TPA: cbb3-type cytochrome c oxidase N-terminal domain-containing protein [Hanamia sp.]|nr:cbb3-type cytochrome c oxidase N-terminal domain-containing protein [Hanamia sp.]
MKSYNNYKKFLLVFLSITGGPVLHAQTTTPATSPNNNYALILLIIVAFLLAFVIWGLSSVLMIYGKKVVEKSKAAGKVLPLLLIGFFTLIGFEANAQDVATEAPKVVHNYAGLSPLAFWTLVSVIALEMLVILVLLVMIKTFERTLSPKKVKAHSLSFSKWWAKIDKKLFTKAVPVEKEADILLDHDYDGIRELDNALPPWWKYGFYLTIGFAIVYLLNYEVLGYGKNPIQEYNEEMAKAKIQMEAYAAKSGNTIDENNIKMPDADGLAKGKEIFTTTCWPCHGKLGEGGVGPNLTDDYWLHKGSLNDIYQSIKHGYPDKGMQAWGKNFSAKEINDLAGYIKTLKGTNPPNGKAPQGDLYVESSSSDSTVTKK